MLICRKVEEKIFQNVKLLSQSKGIPGWLSATSSFSSVLFYYFLCMGVLPACMVCVPSYQKTRRGNWVPWNWSHRGLQAIMRVLSIKSGSSGRSASALNYGTISPVPWQPLHIVLKLFSLSTVKSGITYISLYLFDCKRQKPNSVMPFLKGEVTMMIFSEPGTQWENSSAPAVTGNTRKCCPLLLHLQAFSVRSLLIQVKESVPRKDTLWFLVLALAKTHFHLFLDPRHQGEACEWPILGLLPANSIRQVTGAIPPS